MKVARYLRKSRADENAGLEETLAKHRAILDAYAKEHGLIITADYEEVASGETLYARPEMLRLLEAVENCEYDAVLVMDIDRLGRSSMRDQGMILDAFKHSGTKIITPDKTYDLSDEMDEELTEFKTFMSRRELKIINKRLRRGLRQTIENGGYIANAPYGYRKTVKDRRPTLEIYEPEAAFVRMIFDLYVNQGVGCTVIAETLNSLGAKPHRSAQFGRTSIMHILKNPTFTGKVVWDRKKHIRKGQQGNEKHITIYQPQEKWIVTDGIHPPIIDQETFSKAQEIMKGRYIPPSNDGTVKSSLAGLVNCGQCGKLMQRMGAHQKVPYLLCNTKGCVAGSKFQLVEDRLLSMLEDKAEELEKESAQVKTQDLERMAQAMAATQGEILKAQAQRERLHDLLEQGVYDIPTFQERYGFLTQRLDKLTKTVQNQEKAIEAAKGEDRRKMAQKIRSVLAVYTTSDAQTRNQLLKTLITHVVYNKPKKSKSNEFTLVFELKYF